MGKSNAKKMKPCGYIKPHPAHAYDHEVQSPQPGATRHNERRYCEGVAQAKEAKHVHAWDIDAGPIFREREVDAPGLLEIFPALWNGPFECSCGMSRWLKDGRAEHDRFPKADPMERILALRAKLSNGGPDALDDRDKEELQAIADALIAAIAPLVEAFGKMVEQVGIYLQSFFDSISPETWATLSEMAKAYGEKPDAVETITLMGDDGYLEEIVISAHAPVSAIELRSDDDRFDQEVDDFADAPYDVDSPQMAFPTNSIEIVQGVGVVRGVGYKPDLMEDQQWGDRPVQDILRDTERSRFGERS